MFHRRHNGDVSGSGATVQAGTGDPGVEARTQAIGRELLEQIRSEGGRPLWSQRLINWALRDPHFRTELFRFIDVFPVLTSPQAVAEHLCEYVQQPHVTLPPGLALALKTGRMAPQALAAFISRQIQALATSFIAGRDAVEAAPTLRKMWDRQVGFSLDLLGEACVSDAEAQAFRQRYLELAAALPALVGAWPFDPRIEQDHLGPVPRINISLKISATDAMIRLADSPATIARMAGQLRPLLEAARDHNILINFDMEQFALKDLTLALFQRCCEEVDFPAGLALQAYLVSAEQDVDALMAWARAAGRQVTVRLIKGAYWDYEVVHAHLMNWPAPVWPSKAQTDGCFERLTARLIQALPRRPGIPGEPGIPGVKLALGTHNLRSIAHALACQEAAGLPVNAVEFQLLHGMAGAIEPVLTARGCRVRQYLPLGQVIPGMAYLVRRLLENTSNQSWLRANFAEHAQAETLLAPPEVAAPLAARPMPPADGPAAATGSPAAGEQSEFRNEPLRDFASAAVRARFAQAIAGASLTSIPDAPPAQLERAMAAAAAAFDAWRFRPQSERSAIILRAAELLRGQRDHLAGLMIRESGKTWEEADADVCEAIDMCVYYAPAAQALATPRKLTTGAGEDNTLEHEPCGPAAVIAPWNFPLAIPTGMTVAALVTGNPALLKPAEQSPVVAAALCDLLWQAGVPREVLHLVPGPGPTLGAALVRDPRIALIAFTGSAAVGRDILQAAAGAAAGGTPGVGPGASRPAAATASESANPLPPAPYPFFKRVICETGGKNAIIVDASADLDEAVLGVRHSAFAYAGQKCSACSRVIVLEEVYDLFLGRLIEATRAMVGGDPLDPGTDFGPLIDAPAGAKVGRYIEMGKAQATLALAHPARGQIRGKPLIGPHIFTDVPLMCPLATDEIFGPVLAVFRAATFEEALALANASPCKLTGGLFSRTPSHLAQARRALRVGDLYLNRGITGARVGRQPFGGFGLSGLGTQAGGPEYLAHFTFPRVVAENTLRHGFAPLDEGV